MSSWMLLEDEPDLFDMILAMVEMMGIGGIGFGTGSEAVEWLDKVDNGQIAGPMPELALLDIRMPDEISGVDVAARIRQSNVLNNIVVVLMTAYRLSPAEEERIIDATGVDLIVYKPLPAFRELTQMFNELWDERQQNA